MSNKLKSHLRRVQARVDKVRERRGMVRRMDFEMRTRSNGCLHIRYSVRTHKGAHGSLRVAS